MFSGIIGPPRSGKTYYFVNQILEEFKKFKENNSKYKNIYTNINGFKFDAFEGFVKQYNKASFEEAINFEFTLYQQAESRLFDYGNDYDKFALENGVYKDYHNCLLIIDEAYGTFSTTYEDYKNRFLSYHGHWSIDVVFILQTKRQVNRRYLDNCEVFYISMPSGKRFFSNLFRYKSYSTAETTKNNEIGSFTLKFDKTIASLYNSGSTTIYKSFVFKKLLPLFLMIFAVGFYFFFLGPPKLSKNSNKETLLENTNASVVSPASSITAIAKDGSSIGFTGSFFIRSKCYPHGCSFDGYTLMLGEKNMLKLVNLYKCEIMLHEILSVNYVHYYLRCDSSISEFLQNYKESVNENFKDSSTTLNPVK